MIQITRTQGSQADTISWSSVAGAEGYRFTVQTKNGTVVSRSFNPNLHSTRVEKGAPVAIEALGFVVLDTGVNPIVTPPPPPPGDVIWGDGKTLASWRKDGPHGFAGNQYPSDSGKSFDGPNGVINTIDSGVRGGCRLTRIAEPCWVDSFVHSSKVIIPVGGVCTGRNKSIMAWESKGKKKIGEASDPFYAIEFENLSDGLLHPRVTWFGGQTRKVPGPFAGDPATDWKVLAPATLAVGVPIGREFTMEIFMRQSKQFDGEVKIVFDGHELWHGVNVRTGFADVDVDNGWGNEVVVAWYSDGFTPSDGAPTSRLVCTYSEIREWV